MQPRVAVVLFNLGGPDRPEAITALPAEPVPRPRHSARAILHPAVACPRSSPDRRVRPATGELCAAGWPVAVARADASNRPSPWLPCCRNWMQSASSRCAIGIRSAMQVIQSVRDWSPDEVVLLPLYPQYSTTTTGSSLRRGGRLRRARAWSADDIALCCYPTDAQYIAATVRRCVNAYDEARAQLDPAIPLRVLFSAHGLPETIVRRGDPYQWQIEQTVAAHPGVAPGE